MGTKSIGRCPVRHGCDDRLPDGGVSQVHKLLVISRFEIHVIPQQKVRHIGHGEQLPHTYATHYQRLEPIRFRQLQMHIQKLAWRNRRLHQTLW